MFGREITAKRMSFVLAADMHHMDAKKNAPSRITSRIWEP